MSAHEVAARENPRLRCPKALLELRRFLVREAFGAKSSLKQAHHDQGVDCAFSRCFNEAATLAGRFLFSFLPLKYVIRT